MDKDSARNEVESIKKRVEELKTTSMYGKDGEEEEAMDEEDPSSSSFSCSLFFISNCWILSTIFFRESSLVLVEQLVNPPPQG